MSNTPTLAVERSGDDSHIEVTRHTGARSSGLPC
nr:MAG TPA: hypothetical protein [Caudoviricetes sp.]